VFLPVFNSTSILSEKTAAHVRTDIFKAARASFNAQISASRFAARAIKIESFVLAANNKGGGVGASPAKGLSGGHAQCARSGDFGGGIEGGDDNKEDRL